MKEVLEGKINDLKAIRNKKMDEEAQGLISKEDALKAVTDQLMEIEEMVEACLAVGDDIEGGNQQQQHQHQQRRQHHQQDTPADINPSSPSKSSLKLKDAENKEKKKMMALDEELISTALELCEIEVSESFIVCSLRCDLLVPCNNSRVSLIDSMASDKV